MYNKSYLLGCVLACFSLQAQSSSSGSFLIQSDPNSVQNILRDAVNSYELSVVNTTHKMDYKDHKDDYQFDVDQVHVDKLLVDNTRLAFNVKDANQVQVKLCDIELYGKVDGSLKNSDYDVSLEYTDFGIWDAEIDLTLIPTADGDFWKLDSEKTITAGNMKIVSKDDEINKKLEQMKDTMESALQGLASGLEAHITAKLDNFNDRLAASQVNPTAFMTQIIDTKLVMNASFPQEVQLRYDGFEVLLEGEFYDYVMDTEHVDAGEITFPEKRQNIQETQQFWMHESMINSLFFSVCEFYGIQSFSNDAITTQVKQMFPEFAEKYGDDVEITLKFQLMPQAEDTIRIDAKGQMGLVVDDNKMLMGVDFLAANASVTEPQRELSVAMFATVLFQFEVLEFLFFPIVKNAVISQAFLLENIIGITTDEDKLPGLFTTQFQSFADYITNTYGMGTDLSSLFGEDLARKIKFYVKHFNLSAMFEDEFLHMGFSWRTDPDELSYKFLSE